MTLEQCLYGMMLESANECAYAIAEHVGGTEEKFVSMMNQKAQELGCKNTHFHNTNGLPDEEHYTTARDMALISSAAYKNETFRIITGTGRYVIPPTNKHEDETILQNHLLLAATVLLGTTACTAKTPEESLTPVSAETTAVPEEKQDIQMPRTIRWLLMRSVTECRWCVLL